MPSPLRIRNRSSRRRRSGGPLVWVWVLIALAGVGVLGGVGVVVAGVAWYATAKAVNPPAVTQAQPPGSGKPATPAGPNTPNPGNPPLQPPGVGPKPGGSPPSPPREPAAEFAPKNGMYTARMPAADKASTKLQLLYFGRHTVPLEGAERVAGGTTYTAASLGIPAVVMGDIPADKRFDRIGQALAIGRNAKVAGATDIRQDPVEGKELLLESPAGVARVQVYTIAGWVVTASVEGKDRAAVDTPEADAFFAGVRLTEEAKRLFREVGR